MLTRLVSCEELPPEDDIGDPRVDEDTEGECRASRELPPRPTLLPLACVKDVRRGLLEFVMARVRWFEWVSCDGPEGEAREVLDETDDCRDAGLETLLVDMGVVKPRRYGVWRTGGG